MKVNRRTFFTTILLVCAVIIRIYSANKEWVEDGYATGIYPKLGIYFRTIFGWLPFSFGDIIYGSIFLWLIWKMGKGIKILYQKKATWSGLGNRLWKAVNVILAIYILFNAFWGINYNRKGIAHQLGISKEKYTANDIKQINAILVKKVNETKLALLASKENYPNNAQLFLRIQKAYKNADSVYPFLKYKPASIKSSMWGWLGNYTGFTGYYNPFTGEAQVNTTVPKFLHPFITCHEVAHQLGYAKENEANFVGFLAASLSQDTLLLYSAYLDMFTYSNRNLFWADTASAKAYAKMLEPAVKEDIMEWRTFNAKHKSFLEPAVRWGYTKYLQQNNQPEGMLSYDAVTSFLVGYYKKYGRL